MKVYQRRFTLPHTKCLLCWNLIKCYYEFERNNSSSRYPRRTFKCCFIRRKPASVVEKLTEKRANKVNRFFFQLLQIKIGSYSHSSQRSETQIMAEWGILKKAKWFKEYKITCYFTGFTYLARFQAIIPFMHFFKFIDLKNIITPRNLL